MPQLHSGGKALRQQEGKKDHVGERLGYPVPGVKAAEISRIGKVGNCLATYDIVCRSRLNRAVS